MGVSGGIWGLPAASALMVAASARCSTGSSPPSRSLAPENGYLYCGPAGAGHYVKMVHNGIEYGLMQAYGEGFDILHASEFPLDLAAVAAALEQRIGRSAPGCSSWPADAFAREGNDLAEIRGWVADSGEGRWTVADAIEHDVPAPIITLSLLQRLRSRRDPDSFSDRVLAALRNEFGGHAVKTSGEGS